jgi:hypothetical protein
MLATFIMLAVLAHQPPPICRPSAESWSAPDTGVDIEGAAGVEVAADTGQVSAVTFGAGTVETGSYARVDVREGVIVGAEPIRWRGSCTLTVTVTGGLATLKCSRETCENHCGLNVNIDNGVKSYYCGCNLAPK